MIIDQIKENIKEGAIIPKPEAKGDFIVKGWKKSRGENTLVYLIPNHKNPEKPYSKGITESDFIQAYKQLVNEGIFSRKWFNQNMSRCKRGGPCNYTTIGGIFELLDLAVYTRGLYLKKNNK